MLLLPAREPCMHVSFHLIRHRNMFEVWKVFLECFLQLPAKSSDAVDSYACFRISLELGVDQREPPLNYFLSGRRPVGEGELRHSHAWVQLGQDCSTILIMCLWYVSLVVEWAQKKSCSAVKVFIWREKCWWLKRSLSNKNTKCPIDAHCHRYCRRDPRITKDCIEVLQILSFWVFFDFGKLRKFLPKSRKTQKLKTCKTASRTFTEGNFSTSVSAVFFPQKFAPGDAHCFWQWASKKLLIFAHPLLSCPPLLKKDS